MDAALEFSGWDAKVCARRLALLAATWITAFIYGVLCEICNAVRLLTASEAVGILKSHSADTASVQVMQPSSSRMSGVTPSKFLPTQSPSLRAGFSVPRVGPESRAEHAWSSLAAETFRVRCGPNYAKNGFKSPSAPALGEVVAVDILLTECKIFDLLSLNHIALPEATPEWNESYPEFLVINQMVAKRFYNSMFTNASTDGETYNLLLYVRLPPRLAPGWSADQEPQNAEQLLKRCMPKSSLRFHPHAYQSDSLYVCPLDMILVPRVLRFLLHADQAPAIANCFKEIGVIRNLEVLAGHLPSSLVSLMSKFNGMPPCPSTRRAAFPFWLRLPSVSISIMFHHAHRDIHCDARFPHAGKPILTRPEHYFHRDPQNRYFACDLDGHRYKYLTRSAVRCHA
jgi:hypothetical protein